MLYPGPSVCLSNKGVPENTGKLTTCSTSLWDSHVNLLQLNLTGNPNDSAQLTLLENSVHSFQMRPPKRLCKKQCSPGEQQLHLKVHT